MDPVPRVPAHISQINTVARAVCMAAGGDVIMDQEGLEKILAQLRDYFAPDDVDSLYQEVVRFLQFERTSQTMNEYPARSDLLRW